MSDFSPPKILAIAGSDSCGGAGIEADLKTCSALGVYGAAAVTSVTAQNTQGVRAIHDVPAAVVAQQIDAVIEDIASDAVKSGMLSNVEIIEAVADRLAHYGVAAYVLDPVMVSESGHPLLDPSAGDTLIKDLIPLSLIVTPNIAEAQALTGIAIESENALREAAKAVLDLGPRFVLVKGGHMPGEQAIDLFYDGADFVEFSAPRVETKNTHGTGCTLSAAIAAYLARGHEVVEAIRLSKNFVIGALAHSFDIGTGPGPLNHFWNTHKDQTD